MKPLRVAMVTPYYEPIVGGITSFVRGLVHGLTKEGVVVIIIARDGSRDSTVTVSHGTKARFARRTLDLLRDWRPDVIHAHAHWYALRAALNARDSTRARVVFTFHTSWPKFDPVRLAVLRRMLTRCDAITFPSQSSKSESTIDLPDSLCHVIPPGTDSVGTTPTEIARFRTENIDPTWASTIGYVGKFEWPRKVRGFRILLDAMTSPKLARVGLVVAGGGRQLRDVQSEVRRLGLESRVRLLGDLASPGPLYLTCDVYCHPSLQEGMSMSVLEAMRAGKPVVGLQTSFMREAITSGHEGILVEPDAKALAQALAELIRNPERRARMGEEARARATVRFDWELIAKQFLTVYGVD